MLFSSHKTHFSKLNKLRYITITVVCLFINQSSNSQTDFLDSVILKLKNIPYCCNYKGKYYSYPDEILDYSGKIFFNFRNSSLRIDDSSYKMNFIKNKDNVGYNSKSDTVFHDFKKSPNDFENLTSDFEFMPFLNHPEVIKQFLKTATQTKWILNPSEAILYYEMHKPDSDSGAIRAAEVMYRFSRKAHRLLECATRVTINYNGIIGIDSSRKFYNYIELSEKAINDSINNFKPHSKKTIYQKRNIQNTELSHFPDFKLIDLNTELFDSDNIKSEYVLVEFWSKVCAPCLTNINELIKLRNHYKKEELEIIAINDIDSLDQKLKDFVVLRKINYITLYNAKTFGKSIGITARPNTFIYNKKTKKIVYQELGGWSGYSDHIIKEFDEIAHKPD